MVLGVPYTYMLVFYSQAAGAATPSPFGGSSGFGNPASPASPFGQPATPGAGIFHFCCCLHTVTRLAPLLNPCLCLWILCVGSSPKFAVGEPFLHWNGQLAAVPIHDHEVNSFVIT
jgi:hypothetical protein